MILFLNRLCQKDDNLINFYPPGHGDIYDSLKNSGKLDELLSRGIQYIFISNIDNLGFIFWLLDYIYIYIYKGATLDPKLLWYFISSGKDVMVEVTPKTKIDVLGNIFVTYPKALYNSFFFFLSLFFILLTYLQGQTMHP
jgi:UTP--glucose-1-phosphate uridylyltransferase